MKKVNLEKILFTKMDKMRVEFPDANWYSDEEIKASSEFKHFIEAMKQACKEVLELAAKNARTKYDEDSYCGNTGSEYPPNIIVNKQSILDTINQTE